MSPTSEELADFVAQMHVDYFRENPKGMVTQTILMEREDGTTRVMPCAFANALERELMIGVLRAVMQLEKVVRYATWGEAWFVKMNREDMGDYQSGDLAKDPRRIEVVWTAVVDLTSKVGRCQRIVRGKNGGVRELVADPELDNADLIAGALVDLLPERTIQ